MHAHRLLTSTLLSAYSPDPQICPTMPTATIYLIFSALAVAHYITPQETTMACFSVSHWIACLYSLYLQTQLLIITSWKRTHDAAVRVLIV